MLYIIKTIDDYGKHDICGVAISRSQAIDLAVQMNHFNGSISIEPFYPNKIKSIFDVELFDEEQIVNQLFSEKLAFLINQASNKL